MMKKITYNKPEVLVRHITLESLLAGSPTVTVGDDMGFGDGEARENDAWSTNKGNDIWED